MLSVLRLPPGAGPIQGVSKTSPVAGDPYGTRGTQLVKTRFWSVPSGHGDPLSWVKAHPPAGLALSGWGSGSGPAGATTTLMFDAPATDVWVQAELDITEGALGPSGDVLRADAVVDWLDPRPLPDDAQGPRLRVQESGPCPASDGRSVGVANPGAGLAGRLLPAGDPEAGLVCTYDEEGNGQLTHSVRLAATAAHRWAAAIGEVPLSHTDGLVYACPVSFTTAVVAFAYLGRPDIDIWVQPGGCPVVSNGYVLADRLGSSDLAQLLSPYTARPGGGAKSLPAWPPDRSTA